MKIQNLYNSLEQEVKERVDKLTARSWRGDLSKSGLKDIQWGKDLKEIEQQVLESK